ncbi:MAG TPA: hypothetical protein VHW02_09555 [Rhizomicrobium sp.]|jgi:hypothetical protein|nr:hypothetical protein [Rhizomicrobium sp.]
MNWPVAVTTALILSIPSHAQSETSLPKLDSPMTADVQCLVAIMETREKIDRLMPGVSQGLVMYYFGKLDGRNPNLDLETMIRDVSHKMSSTDIGAADMRCGRQLTKRGLYLSTIGQHLMNNPDGPSK